MKFSNFTIEGVHDGFPRKVSYRLLGYHIWKRRAFTETVLSQFIFLSLEAWISHLQEAWMSLLWRLSQFLQTGFQNDSQNRPITGSDHERRMLQFMNWSSFWKPSQACLEDNNGCEHYCTVDKYLRPYCLCKNDFVLAKDEKSCRQNCQFRLSEPEGIISSTGISK